MGFIAGFLMGAGVAAVYFLSRHKEIRSALDAALAELRESNDD